MIEFTDVTKEYGEKKAVNNISFKINKGEIIGLLGPNGAGKSTTMNILTGYIAPTYGTVTVNGYSMINEPQKARKAIGYLPENPPLYMEMTVIDYLKFVYDIKGCTEPKDTHIDEIMKLVKIKDVEKRLIKNLSKGYKQRIGLAGAMIGNPEILILDEPTVGLDPQQITEIRDIIKKLGRERTVIVSSHILSEISEICQRIIIINKGQIIANSSIANIKQNIAQAQDNTVVAEFIGDREQIVYMLKNIEGVEKIKISKNGQYTLIITEDIREKLFHECVKNNITILTMYIKQLTLEEIFLQLTNNERNETNV